MSKSPVVQVRLDSERLAFLDGLPGTRSEAIRYCVDFTSGARTPRSKIEERVQREVVKAAPSAYRFTVDECAHTYESRGRCLGCGRVR